MNLFIWRTSGPTPQHCELSSPKLWSTKKLHVGESVLDEYQNDLVYSMSNFVPDGHILRDTYSVAGQVLISGGLKSFLEKELLATHKIEFLPVSIADHDNNIVSKDYFILHPLGMIDCIDVKKSQGKFNPLRKEVLTSCKGLVLIYDKIPKDTKMFRPKHWGFNLMITGDFCERLASHNFVGFRFIKAEGFNGIS